MSNFSFPSSCQTTLQREEGLCQCIHTHTHGSFSHRAELPPQGPLLGLEPRAPLSGVKHISLEPLGLGQAALRLSLGSNKLLLTCLPPLSCNGFLAGQRWAQSGMEMTPRVRKNGRRGLMQPGRKWYRLTCLLETNRKGVRQSFPESRSSSCQKQTSSFRNNWMSLG